MKQKYIFSYRLMSYLLSLGFCQIDMFKDYDDTQIYVFIDSSQLRAAIREYNKYN